MELAKKITPACKNKESVPRTSVTDKRKGKETGVPKKSIPSMRSRGTLIGSFVAPMVSAPVLEEWVSDFGDDDYTPCLLVRPVLS